MTTTATPKPSGGPQRLGDWMQTYTGQAFWPLDPRAEEVRIEDIAHALSNLCRYGGHCLQFYSVAQHSVIVSEICPPGDALWGLLHDAPEAYLVDLPRPIKRFSRLGEFYQAAERQIETVIRFAYGLPEMPPSIKVADNVALATEMRDLMAPPPMPWRHTELPLSRHIRPMDPFEAEAQFLRRFYVLKGGAA